MLIALLFHFSICDPANCNSSYDGTVDIMSRCTVKGTVSFTGKEQTAIYLHNTDKSSRLEIMPHEGTSDVISVLPGKGIQIIGSNADVNCAKGSCIISFWHTEYDKDSGRFASDGAGCSVYTSGSYVSSRFPIFFDFGDNARFQAGNFTHKRETGITLYYENETYVEHIVVQGELLELKGPGILHISSTKFEPAVFDFIIGSKIKIPSYFSNEPTSGNFSLYEVKNGVGNYIENPIDGPDPAQILLAKEQRAWYNLSIVMICLTVLTFIASIASTVVIIISNQRSKKGV